MAIFNLCPNNGKILFAWMRDLKLIGVSLVQLWWGHQIHLLGNDCGMANSMLGKAMPRLRS